MRGVRREAANTLVAAALEAGAESAEMVKSSGRHGTALRVTLPGGRTFDFPVASKAMQGKGRRNLLNHRTHLRQEIRRRTEKDDACVGRQSKL